MKKIGKTVVLRISSIEWPENVLQVKVKTCFLTFKVGFDKITWQANYISQFNNGLVG